MPRTLNKVLLALAVALALCSGGLIANLSWAQSATLGTWTHFPPQTPTFTAVVRPPIKADGSSVVNDGAALPVKFKLLTGPGVFLFDSVWSNNDVSEGGSEGEHGDDFAFLTFTPAGSLTFNDITNLTANYSFATGNCQGGSLRWAVTFDIGNDDNTVPGEGEPNPTDNDRSIFIYYGGLPNFDDCTSGGNNQSGINMVGLSDFRYDTSQLGGTFYDTYANAQLIAGPQTGDNPRPALRVASVTLALDSGWMQDETGAFKDQSVILAGARVNDNLFVPVTGNPTATCDLPLAAINVVEDTGGYVVNPLNVQRKIADTFYRNTNDCTYSYELATSSLFGPGNYKAYVVIDNHIVLNPGSFKLR